MGLKTSSYVKGNGSTIRVSILRCYLFFYSEETNWSGVLSPLIAPGEFSVTFSLYNACWSEIMSLCILADVKSDVLISSEPLGDIGIVDGPSLPLMEAGGIPLAANGWIKSSSLMNRSKGTAVPFSTR